jgi:hypothetical protein
MARVQLKRSAELLPKKQGSGGATPRYHIRLKAAVHEECASKVDGWLKSDTKADVRLRQRAVRHISTDADRSWTVLGPETWRGGRGREAEGG